jgi:hypothetical protein
MVAPSTTPNRRIVPIVNPERALRATLFVLAGFVALCALAGGLALVLNPDGSALGLSVARLEPTPFTSFVIPGFVLAALGAAFAFAAVLTALGRREGWWLCAACGVALIVWVIAQIALIGYGSVLQSLFFALGVATVALAAAVGRRARRA